MIDILSLPKFIEAPGGGMWRIMPAEFTIANKDSVFVKLKDVEAMLSGTVAVTKHEKTVTQDGEEFVYVGKGGQYLIDVAAEYGWELYAARGLNGKLTGPWNGDEPDWEYFKKV